MQKKLSRWKFGAALAATFLCLVGAPALASAASSSDDAGLQAVERMMQSIDMEAAFKDSLGLSSPENRDEVARFTLDDENEGVMAATSLRSIF